MEKEKISLVIRQNDNGVVYGLTYIDHNTKCVFNGSDIGKEYSAKAILEKCGITQHFPSQNKSLEPKVSETNSMELPPDKIKQQEPDLSKIMEAIITPSEEYPYKPFDLRKRKRRSENRISY